MQCAKATQYVETVVVNKLTELKEFIAYAKDQDSIYMKAYLKAEINIALVSKLIQIIEAQTEALENIETYGHDWAFANVTKTLTKTKKLLEDL